MQLPNNDMQTFSFFKIELNDPNPKMVYLEMNRNMDKMAYWTNFLFTKLTFPIFVSSNLLLTAINYFILDMGNESYFLPSPILYVDQSKQSHLKKKETKIEYF